MGLSQDLTWRGLIKDKTFADKTWLDTPRTFYLGIDASDNSLTIGNLAVVTLARRLAEAGWKAVLLAGGATSLVGDPGGKDEERPLKSLEEISANVEAVKKQIENLFAGQSHQMVNNLDWLGGLGYLNFLRDVGKHYSMTELMQRDFVSARMNQGGSGISYAEFSYSLLQGYDFWWLSKNKSVVLQIGASDQWGNMLSGVPLIRKKEGKDVHAMSMPLVVNKLTGKKFGKSEDGAVWLDPAKTSPAQFYQFWINSDDADSEDYLKIFTFLEKDKIEHLINSHKQNPAQRLAQKNLAYEVTKLVHGQDQADKQQHIAQALSGEETIGALSDAEIATVRQEIPNLTVQPGTPVIEVLAKTGLAASNSEARRLVQSQAVYVDNQPFPKDHLETGDFKNGRLILRRGKAFKDSALIELAQ